MKSEVYIDRSAETSWSGRFGGLRAKGRFQSVTESSGMEKNLPGWYSACWVGFKKTHCLVIYMILYDYKCIFTYRCTVIGETIWICSIHQQIGCMCITRPVLCQFIHVLAHPSSPGTTDNVWERPFLFFCVWKTTSKATPPAWRRSQLYK